MSSVRVQKIIASAGICSRRDAEALIKHGEVTVNGQVATLGQRANPESDHIKIRGKLIRRPENRVIIALYKPRDVWCTTRPLIEGEIPHETIFDMIPKIKERVLPVGKLDADSEGVVLLTNDGDLSRRLLDQKYEIPKTWRFKIDGHIEVKKLQFMTRGMKVEGARIKVSSAEIEKQLEGKTWVNIKTTEVQNRILRKAFEKLSHPVDKAQRTAFGSVNIEGMQRGQYRYLTSHEVKKLKEMVGLR